MTLKTTWTRRDVARITGIPDRRVLFYTEQLVIPDFRPSVGRGTPRQYSIMDLFYFLLIKELDSLGLSLTRIKGIIYLLHARQLFNDKKLWISGTFTEEPTIMIISLYPEDHMQSTDSETHYPDEFYFSIVPGSTEIKLKADRPSQIVINLNKIFKRIG